MYKVYKMKLHINSSSLTSNYQREVQIQQVVALCKDQFLQAYETKVYVVMVYGFNNVAILVIAVFLMLFILANLKVSLFEESSSLFIQAISHVYIRSDRRSIFKNIRFLQGSEAFKYYNHFNLTTYTNILNQFITFIQH